MPAEQTDAVSRVYAEALLGLAKQNNDVDGLAEEVAGLGELLDGNADLRKLIASPVIADDKRRDFIQRTFEGKTSDTLYKFIQVLSRKGRLASLPGVCTAFAGLVAQERGQIDVEAIVAQELDDATAQRVARELGESMNKTVNLQQTVDPSLIGGMRLRIGDRLIDASVATRLKNAAARLAAVGREKARTTLIAD